MFNGTNLTLISKRDLDAGAKEIQQFNPGGPIFFKSITCRSVYFGKQ